MKYIKNCLYLILFALLNLILSFDVIIHYLILVFLSLPAGIADIFLNEDGPGALVFGIPFAIWIYLVYMLGKFTVLPIIYEFSNKSGGIFLFLNKLKEIKILKYLVLATVLLLDIYTHKLLEKDTGHHFQLWNIFTGNLLICYISMLVWFKYRGVENSRTKILKFIKKGIITITIFVAAITLLYFLLVLCAYLIYK